MAPVNHAAKKILILAVSEFRIEGQLVRRKNISLQKNVSRAPFSPVDHEPRGIRGTRVKLAFQNPLRRSLVEITIHRAKHAIHAVFVAGVEQSDQPALDRK